MSQIHPVSCRCIFWAPESERLSSPVDAQACAWRMLSPESVPSCLVCTYRPAMNTACHSPAQRETGGVGRGSQGFPVGQIPMHSLHCHSPSKPILACTLVLPCKWLLRPAVFLNLYPWTPTCTTFKQTAECSIWWCHDASVLPMVGRHLREEVSHCTCLRA